MGRSAPRGASAVIGWVGAGQDLGGVGDVNGQFVPDLVCGNEGKGAGRVVLRAEVASHRFSFLKPRLKIGSRVVGERLGKGEVHVR